VTNRDIICLSTHYWDERRYRKQEFMSRFAAENRVLFVEPSFSMARRPQLYRREVATNRFLRSTVRARDHGLHTLTLPRGLPKWTDPRVEHLNYRLFGQLISKACARLGFREAVLWVYNPSYVHALDAIPHRHLVFDLVDDLSAYDGTDQRRSAAIERNVKSVVERCDLLSVTAETLRDRYAPHAARSVHVPNGFDPTWFAADGAAGPLPEQLAGLPRPILGFVGTIFTLLDFELLAHVARVHHDKSLVLVGPVEASAVKALSALTEIPNVTHIGPQPQSAIPSYVAAFDVCLNVFVAGAVADSVSPLKVYEYLAMGRPVVSVPMASLQRESASDVVAFAADADAFCRQIDRCLGDEVQAASRTRTEAVAAYSWGELFKVVDSACDEAFGS
jgi:glycosyltransferase involved in cell wall biosynthesis